MTSKPAARERFESMLNGGFRHQDERVDFLIKLVEAAVAEAKEYCELMHEDGFVNHHRENDVWEGIIQRLAEVLTAYENPTKSKEIG